jgi:hypothetical protein
MKESEFNAYMKFLVDLSESSGDTPLPLKRILFYSYIIMEEERYPEDIRDTPSGDQVSIEAPFNREDYDKAQALWETYKKKKDEAPPQEETPPEVVEIIVAPHYKMGLTKPELSGFYVAPLGEKDLGKNLRNMDKAITNCPQNIYSITQDRFVKVNFPITGMFTFEQGVAHITLALSSSFPNIKIITT